MRVTQPFTSYEDAVDVLLARAPTLGNETVALDAARGRVLRGPIVADRDQPPFNRSTMDGFAVRSGEVKSGGTFAVTGDVPAGAAAVDVGKDGVLRIATGAAVPVGFDAVVPIEQANVRESNGTEQVTFDIDKAEPWTNIHRRASDAAAGDTIIEAGTLLAAQHVGIAAAVGATSLLVAKLPRITLLTTGDEIRPPDTSADDLQPQQIRNSNGPLLASLLDAFGAPLLQHIHVADEAEQTLAAAREALSHSHLVLTCGGVSVGQRDWLPWAWEQLGYQAVVHGVNIKPGKPLLVAAPPDDAPDNKLVVGLPGNPVSTLVCAHLFVWPLLRSMLRVQRSEAPWSTAALAADVRPNPARQLFRTVRLDADGKAVAVTWQGSGDLMHTAVADGVVRLPLQSDPVAAGTRLPFLRFAE